MGERRSKSLRDLPKPPGINEVNQSPRQVSLLPAPSLTEAREGWWYLLTGRVVGRQRGTAGRLGQFSLFPFWASRAPLPAEDSGGGVTDAGLALPGCRLPTAPTPAGQRPRVWEAEPMLGSSPHPKSPRDGTGSEPRLRPGCAKQELGCSLEGPAGGVARYGARSMWGRGRGGAASQET